MGKTTTAQQLLIVALQDDACAAAQYRSRAQSADPDTAKILSEIAVELEADADTLEPGQG